MCACEAMNFSKLIDMRDLVFMLALGLLGYGLYRIHPPLAFITLGTILLVISVVSFLREVTKGIFQEHREGYPTGGA